MNRLSHFNWQRDRFPASGVPRNPGHNGHRQEITGGCYSRDGRWIATAAVDGSVRVWEAASERHWQTLAIDGVIPHQAIFRPDSQSLLISTSDGLTRLWPVDLLPLAESRLPRYAAEFETAQ